MTDKEVISGSLAQFFADILAFYLSLVYQPFV